MVYGGSYGWLKKNRFQERQATGGTFSEFETITVFIEWIQISARMLLYFDGGTWKNEIAKVNKTVNFVTDTFQEGHMKVH